MWEDDNAWNSYADSGSTGSEYGDWNSYGMGEPSNQSYDWSGTPAISGGGWDQSYNTSVPYSSPYESWGGMKSNENYTFEPKYNPGAAWNPSATQILSGNPSTEELYNRMGGMPGATFYRGQPEMVNNPQMRDVEHYAAANEMAQNPFLMSNPIYRVTGLALPPAYSGAKWVAQNLPDWLQPYLPSYLTQASPPSWNEVWSGMKPFLK